MKQRTHRSPEERQEILAKVKAAIKSGSSVGEACEQAGIYKSIYRQWLARGVKGARRPTVRKPAAMRPKAQPSLQTFIMPDAAKDSLVLIIGKTDQVTAALDRLVALRG